MTAQEQRRDPTEAFADLLNDLDVHVRAANRHARLDESNRLTLLFGHGIFAILTAPGFAALALTGMASPSFVVLRHIPGNPWAMAAVVAASGATLAAATWQRRRPWEYAALVALLTWYATLAASLIGAVGIWMAEPGPPDWAHAPSLYAPVVYAHLTYVMAGHARTIRRKGLLSHGPPT